MLEIVLVTTIFLKIYFIYFLNISKKIWLNILGVTSYFYFSNLYLYGKIKSIEVDQLIYQLILVSLFILISLLPYFIFLITLYKNKLKSKIHRIIYFSLSVLVSDITASFLIGYILQKDPTSTVFDFSYMSPGYALAYTPLANFVNIYYVFGLTFFIALFISICNEYKIKYSYMYLFIFASLFYFVDRNKIQYNYIPEEKILILGENNSIFSEENKSKLLKNNYEYYLDNYFYIEKSSMYIVSRLYDKGLNNIGLIKKYSLGPMGEYYPYKLKFLTNMFNVEKNLNNSQKIDSVNEANLLSVDDKKVMILICADAWSYVSIKRYDNKKNEISYIILQRDENSFNDIIFQEANIKLYKAVLSKYFNKPVIDVK